MINVLVRSRDLFYRQLKVSACRAPPQDVSQAVSLPSISATMPATMTVAIPSTSATP